jgi:hypothetical protein
MAYVELISRSALQNVNEEGHCDGRKSDMVGLGGLEPPTSPLSVLKSLVSQLSSHPGHLILSIWDFYLRVRTRLCRSDRRRDPIDVQPDDWPS